jgi:hypothetical protein
MGESVMRTTTFVAARLPSLHWQDALTAILCAFATDRLAACPGRCGAHEGLVRRHVLDLHRRRFSERTNAFGAAWCGG